MYENVIKKELLRTITQDTFTKDHSVWSGSNATATRDNRPITAKYDQEKDKLTIISPE
jgi:hypothetical protein